jgi:hypothetical protein
MFSYCYAECHIFYTENMFFIQQRQRQQTFKN